MSIHSCAVPAALHQLNRRILAAEGQAIESNLMAGRTFVFESPGQPPLPLRPNGNRVQLMAANRGEYARLIAQHVMQGAVEAQLEALCDGFFAVTALDLDDFPTLLTAADLRAMLSGGGPHQAAFFLPQSWAVSSNHYGQPQWAVRVNRVALADVNS